MTMLAALDRARELNAFARPIGERDYAYRWGHHGTPGLRVTAAREPSRRNAGGPVRLRYVEDDLCNVTRRMLADEWLVCRRDGEEL